MMTLVKAAKIKSQLTTEDGIPPPTTDNPRAIYPSVPRCQTSIKGVYHTEIPFSHFSFTFKLKKIKNLNFFKLQRLNLKVKIGPTTLIKCSAA